MTGPEGFLSRWTRLKREAAESRETPPNEPRESSADASAPADVSVPSDTSSLRNTSASDPAARGDAAADPSPPAVDLSALPSIESITASTDIRPFLAPGVPAELTRAALRRVWVTDPKIRDFIGIAENQWDFTADNAIPGFGPLSPLDDVRRLVAQVMGERTAAPEAPAPEPEGHLSQDHDNPAVSAADCSIEHAVPDVSVRPHQDANPDGAAGRVENEADVAAQQDIAATAPAKRSHGGALPK